MTLYKLGFVFLLVALALVAPSCGDGDGDDGGTDTSSTGDVADSSGEATTSDTAATDTLGIDTTADTTTDDTAGEVLADTSGPACPVVPPPLQDLDPSITKFAVSSYHFNLQYVAGGLEGFGGDDMSYLWLDEEEMEDQIIVESFEPLLDVLLDHPSWGIDVELQAYMVEVIRERHPAILDKLQTLVGNGQISLNSFHFSDQLWLAYPKESMERSLELVRAEFETSCLPVGTTVFTQEGQYSAGMGPVMASHGYDTILLANNLFKYHYGDEAAQAHLWYSLDDTKVILANEDITDEESGLTVHWHFMDDGELEVTGMLNPYFGTTFVKSDQAVQMLVDELTGLEEDGYAVVTVAQYTHELEVRGVEAPAMLDIVDGPWQPADTLNVWRWMGGAGNVDEDENDNGVLTANMQSRKEILVAEALLAHLSETADPDPAYADAITQAWYEQTLAECSDSTGWNPFVNEVEYSLGHAAEALAIAQSVVDDLMAALDTPHVAVDLTTGAVQLLDDLPLAEDLEKGEAPFDLILDTPGWEVTVEWYEHPSGAQQVRITGIPGDTPSRTIAISFPFATDTIAFSYALQDDQIVAFPMDEFLFTETALPTPNGLVAIGDDQWLVLDLHSWHIAPKLTTGGTTVDFVDQTLDTSGPFHYVAYVLDGTADQALALAQTINLGPQVLR